MFDHDIKSAFAAFKQEVKPLPPVEVTAASEPVPVKARLNYTAVGVCPYCSKPMTKSQACGQTVFVCMDDRSVTPLPNSDL